MKNVLLLAYYFPPIGGAGVQRAVKFVKYLPDFDWLPTVVTGPGTGRDRWAPADATLGHDVGSGVPVRRTSGPEPPRSAGSRARAERWLRLTTPFSEWWTSGCVAAGQANASGIDAIVATMSPFETAAAAASLAALLGRPWVADLRDPWALDEMTVYPSRIHRRLELRRMRYALSSAAAVVMNTPEAAARLVRSFPEFGARAVVIPNGFDKDDFSDQPPKRDDTAFRIVHAGYLHTELGGPPSLARRVLGGGVVGVDIGARSHLHLLEAIARIRARRPKLAEQIEVHLAGVVSDSDRATLTDPSVREHGYLSHAETVSLMQSADLLFLPMQDLPPGVRATIVPGKTYEYLAAGPPILGAVPAGDARDLLTAAGGAVVCDPRDVAGMAEAIVSLIEGGRADPRDPEVVEQFERRRLTGRLAGVLDSVCA